MQEIVFQEKNFGFICEKLRAGEVCLFPSDTSYGFSADPFCPDAIQIIQKIKGRDASKPFLLLMADKEMAEEYGFFDTDTKNFASQRWRQMKIPTTILIPKKKVLQNFFPTHDLVGIRVPTSRKIQKFLRFWKKPLISTSANLTGEDPIFAKKVILEKFSKKNILFVDFGDLPPEVPSEIWKSENTKLVRLR